MPVEEERTRKKKKEERRIIKSKFSCLDFSNLLKVSETFGVDITSIRIVK